MGLDDEYLSGIKDEAGRFLNESPRSMVGYGASATGTVLMRYLEIENCVNAIVDDNPRRQGLFAPHTAIPVRSPSTLSVTDVCLILA